MKSEAETKRKFNETLKEIERLIKKRIASREEIITNTK